MVEEKIRKEFSTRSLNVRPGRREGIEEKDLRKTPGQGIHLSANRSIQMTWKVPRSGT